MAQSKCTKCGGVMFEMVETSSIVGTDLKWNFVQCVACGGVVGVVDFFANGGVMQALGKIKQKLGIA